MHIPGALDIDEWNYESNSEIDHMINRYRKEINYKFAWIILFIQVLYFPLFSQELNSSNNDPFIVILGTLQDGGSPHIGCQKDCCKVKDAEKKVVSLGLIDPAANKKFLFEATPDITEQLKKLDSVAGFISKNKLDGIFLTHAHIGHYSGLMFLGKEAWNSNSIPVYAMPKMKLFLENNGPWSQLAKIKNIILQDIKNKLSTKISENLIIIPYTVPHRDEFSETVGYKIIGPNKSALFIPDIDKWSKWDMNITEVIKEVDYAFIDGTFYGIGELNNRNMEEVPHPLITESMELFGTMSEKDRNKIWFIHLNHTNPALNKNAAEYNRIIDKGFHVASNGQLISL